MLLLLAQGQQLESHSATQNFCLPPPNRDTSKFSASLLWFRDRWHLGKDDLPGAGPNTFLPRLITDAKKPKGK